MNIAIIGATGLIGSNLLSELIKNDSIDKITTITRRSVPDSPKVNQIILTDMDSNSIEALDVNADVYFCALGTTIKTAGSKENFKKIDKDLVVSFAKLAKKDNAKAFFVVSAAGSNKNSKIFYNKVKGEMEEAVIALGLPSLYILQPGLLAGERKEKRFAENIGIQAFYILDFLIPKKITHHIGTFVSDIVSYSTNEFSNIKAGINRISRFYK